MYRFKLLSLSLLLSLFVFPGKTLAQTIPNNLTPGSITLTSTFHSIGISASFSGDGNANATANLQFKKTTDTVWRNGLPLWRVDNSSGGYPNAFYGSALLLDPNTDYQIQVTVSDPDGVVGNNILSAQIKTRAENILAASQLWANTDTSHRRYVRADGSDLNDGLTPTTAWKTLAKALSSTPAPDTATYTIQVGPGYYAIASQTPHTKTMNIVAEFPAMDDSRNIINPGQHAVIEPKAVSSPSGSGGPNAGVWQPAPLLAPGNAGDNVVAGSTTYNVWKWAASPVANANTLSYALTRDGVPQRVTQWDWKINLDSTKGNQLTTPEGWAEKMFTNQSYHYGFASYGNDIYLRLPKDDNPNNYWVWASGGEYAMIYNAPNMRISGLEFKSQYIGIYILTNSSNTIIDHNLFQTVTLGVYNKHQISTPPAPDIISRDNLIQYNRFSDTNFWSEDQINKPSIPWRFVKSNIKNADGTLYATPRIGGVAEGAAYSAPVGATNLVFRYNTCDGEFDCFDELGSGTRNPEEAKDVDMYSNIIQNNADDPFEPEKTMINFRAWNNKTSNTLTFFSSGPINKGPVYIFRNTAWRVGNHGIARFPYLAPSDITGVGFKYSGQSSPSARMYVVNNTIWTNVDSSNPNAYNVNTGSQDASSGSKPEWFWLRNNIFRSTEYAFDALNSLTSNTSAWNEDYNIFSTTNAARGLRYKTKIYNGTTTGAKIADYRIASGQGAHSNLNILTSTDVPFIDTSIIDNNLTNPLAADLTLKSGTPLIDAGVIVPNIADKPGLDYAGSAPDLGASEFGLGIKPGDVDANGRVDIFDYNQVVTDFGKTGTYASDLDKSGTVDIFDYNIVVANFGK